MKNIIRLLTLIVITVTFASCNDDWNEEQFSQMVSFKATPNSLGVTDIYVRYKPGGQVVYELPLIVSGSTDNSRDLNVNISIDEDTLNVLNIDKYGSRSDLYFEMLPKKYYSFPSEVKISAGKNEETLPITFNFDGIDLAEKYVLPITIEQTEGSNYTANPRKYYRKALLHIIPFNDFSGTYSGSNLIGSLDNETNNPLTQSQYRAYVVNDSTIFFYAGLRDEDFVDRRNYKVYLKFTDDQYRMGEYYCEMYSDNPMINLKVNKQPKYKVEEEMDATKTYLKHTYITITDIDYEFTDYTTINNYELKYHMTGSLALQRDLNTLIPDQDQGIQW